LPIFGNHPLPDPLCILKLCRIYRPVKTQQDIFLLIFSLNLTIIWTNLLSNNLFTDQEAKEHFLNLPSNRHSLSGASSKNCKPHYKAKAVSFLNGMMDMKSQKGSFISCNLGSKKCHWCYKHSLGTGSGHIYTLCTELQARRDRNSVKMPASLQDVAITLSSNSSKWIFDTSTSSHMTLDRNWFKSFSSGGSNEVLPDKTLVEYTDLAKFISLVIFLVEILLLSYCVTFFVFQLYISLSKVGIVLS
jgi:hypothetical protein